MAALALGVFVLSKAFPSGEETVTPTSPGASTLITSPPPSPEDTGTKGGGGNNGGNTGEPRDPADVQLQVLNGTDVAGLAAGAQEQLESAGYRVLTIGDASGGPYDTTRISYLKRAQADAQVLEQDYFPGAELEVAAPDAQVDVTVILGQDYADTQSA